ncbi:putative MT-associated protein TORTIFOLIA1/SPIRAL2 [Dioscorea sansibarensis]
MAPPSSHDLLKLRINQCFIKLSDRDTESMAASELESLALSLSSSSLPSFLSALSDTRPSDKPPLRRHSLRLLSLLTRSHPPSLLLPHLPRMLSAALRRLRDPDSSVRAACVDAFRSLAGLSLPSTGSLPPLLLHSLSDALLHEQDHCAQISASLSLAAAVDVAAGSPASVGSDLADQLQRLVPRFVKLVRSIAFKAKPALISLLGSIAGAGGASTGTLLGVLIPCLVEFLSSEDWAARKAAAEALSRVALSERDLLGGFRSSCLSSFESRKFDKVKIVRDSMNQMVKVWKDIPVAVVEDSNGASPLPDSNSKSSVRDNASDSGRIIAGSRTHASASVGKKKLSMSRSPPPDATPPSTVRRTTPPSTGLKTRPKFTRQRNGSDLGVAPMDVRSGMDSRRRLFMKTEDGKLDKVVSLKSSCESTVQETASLEQTGEIASANTELCGSQKDNNLSLIRMQLVQIENQQSNLLEILQKFIGSSQNGIHSLETRVHGLELALEKISHDLAVSSGRFTSNDSSAKTCCSLPGAEFLSSKFWRRTEGRSSKLLMPSNTKLTNAHHLAENKIPQSCNWDKPRLGLQANFVVNPLAETNPYTRGSSFNT